MVLSLESECIGHLYHILSIRNIPKKLLFKCCRVEILLRDQFFNPKVPLGTSYHVVDNIPGGDFAKDGHGKEWPLTGLTSGWVDAATLWGL